MKKTLKSPKKSAKKIAPKSEKKNAISGPMIPDTGAGFVIITNPQTNSNNALIGGNFTFTGNFNGVNSVHLFLLQAGAANIDMGFANLNQATHTWSRTFGPIAPNPAPAAAYDLQAIGDVGGAADVKQNIRFV